MNCEEAEAKRAGEVGLVGQVGQVPAAAAAGKSARIERLRKKVAEIDIVRATIGDMLDALAVRLRRVVRSATEQPYPTPESALDSMDEYVHYRMAYKELEEVLRLELLQRKEWQDEIDAFEEEAEK